jgi:hypothetical protein
MHDTVSWATQSRALFRGVDLSYAQKSYSVRRDLPVTPDVAPVEVRECANVSKS